MIGVLAQPHFFVTFDGLKLLVRRVRVGKRSPLVGYEKQGFHGFGPSDEQVAGFERLMRFESLQRHEIRDTDHIHVILHFNGLRKVSWGGVTRGA